MKPRQPNMPPHTKPDCTGQRFGRLKVVGRGEKRTRGNQKHWTWRLLCDCGNIIDLIRSDFDKQKGQRSCGCLGKVDRKQQVDNKRRPQDLLGQRFGLLIPQELLPVRKGGKALWRCLCDCGGTTDRTSVQLLSNGGRFNCGNPAQHLLGAKYPDTPTTLPGVAWEVVKKYRHLAIAKDEAVAGRKLDRLLRVAWILWYREYKLGEKMSEIYIGRYVRKSLAFASVDQFWEKKIEAMGGQLIDIFGKTRKLKSGYNWSAKNKIGKDMANLIFPIYPLRLEKGKICMSKAKKRCYGVKTC